MSKRSDSEASVDCSAARDAASLALRNARLGAGGVAFWLFHGLWLSLGVWADTAGHNGTRQDGKASTNQSVALTLTRPRRARAPRQQWQRAATSACTRPSQSAWPCAHGMWVWKSLPCISEQVSVHPSPRITCLPAHPPTHHATMHQCSMRQHTYDSTHTTPFHTKRFHTTHDSTHHTHAPLPHSASRNRPHFAPVPLVPHLCQLLAVVHVTAAVDLASDLTRVRSRQRAARVDALERRGAAAATIAAALAGRLPVSRQPGKADAACNAFAGLAAVAGVSVAIERPAVLRLVAVIVHPRRWAVDR
eukprot:363139-Chlamydomonas_euryale.AAC.2